ncbi:hypothetical protein GCM10029976_067030 [Kribbella albertanoniae]
MAEISCAHCRKTWDTHYLRHEMGWFKCVDCGAPITKFRDGSWQDNRFPWQGSPGNCTHPLGGELHWNITHRAGVPDEIADSLDPEAWFEAVVADLGCPECGVHGGGPAPRMWTLMRWVRSSMRKIKRAAS